MTEAEALDMAARAAGWPNGWGEASRFAPNNLFNAIREHAATLMENAALKAENERLRAALAMCVAEMMRASGRLEIIATCNEDRRIVAALSGTCDYARTALERIDHD